MKHPRLALVVIAFVLAALVLTVSGCDVDGVKEYQDPMTLIEVEKGDEFAIVLESNPTTGYAWELAEPLDEEIIHLVKTEFEEPDVELLGASGEEKWTFKAEGLGDTSITLSYVRPWEEEEEPPLMEEEEAETEGEEAAEETAEAEDEGTSETEETAMEEEGPTTVTFNVRVKKAGSTDKSPEKYSGDEVSEPIEVEVGLEFAIVLESNPTTGYSWQLAEPLDEDILELVSTEFEEKKPEGTEETPLGAPGEEVWTFEAIGEGSAEIELEYVRPWETDAAPEETKTFEVEVKPAHEGEEEGGH